MAAARGASNAGNRPAGGDSMATRPLTAWRLRLARGRTLVLRAGVPRVMGILNVTPDSFSDGGRFLDPARAVEHGLRMLSEGAELLDLGAESTRPGGGVYGAGAAEVPESEEIERLLPVLEALRRRTDAPISVDTRKAAVARAALEAGADLINDVGTLRDPALLAAVAEAGCPAVAMHSRGVLATMQRTIAFEDVVREVAAELEEACCRGVRAGIARDQMVLDPGLGFGKTRAQNLELLCHTAPLLACGRPLLFGASRKSFLAPENGRPGFRPSPVPADQRLAASLAAAGWATRCGAALLRVHDVAETVQFLGSWQAIAQAGANPR